MTTHDRRRETGHSRTTTAVMEARYWPTEKAYAALEGAEYVEATEARADTAALAQVRTLHEQWGDTRTDELDPLDMWEQLGRALGVLS